MGCLAREDRFQGMHEIDRIRRRHWLNDSSSGSMAAASGAEPWTLLPANHLQAEVVSPDPGVAEHGDHGDHTHVL